jgi:Protein of unknown function (DUF3987)
MPDAQEEPIWGPHDGEPVFDPWENYIVPHFPLEILPAPIARFVIEQARVIGCDRSALAMACLAAFSGALDHRFRLKMMRHGPWYVSSRLWVLLVGDVSVKKTPIINAALAEIETIQGELQKEYKRQYAEYKKALSVKNDPKPEEPQKPQRYISTDTTVEAIADILSRSPRGILIKRDELSGWLGSMEKYGGTGGANSDRAFWLQSFNGGCYTVDRIKRGETFIENLSVSIIGSIQPEKLGEIHGLTSDGLMQRFLPITVRSGMFATDTPVNVEAYQLLIRQLTKMKPADLILADDALPVMEDLRRRLHELEQVGDGIAHGFTGFVGKLAGYAGSLVLLLHLISAPEGSMLVYRQTVENVKKLVLDFILRHAYEFYRTADTVTDGDRIKRIASWIVTSGVKMVTARDLTRNVTGMRGLGARAIHARVSPLVAGGWLLPDQPHPEYNTKWEVTPAVARQFAARKREEERRKAEVARLMNSPRKSGCR